MVLFTVLCSLSALFGISEGINPSLTARTWRYDVISLESNSSNEELFKWDIYVERISRSEYGLSGNITVNTDINDEYVSLEIYRSARGNNDYKRTPFKLKKQKVSEFVNGAYKDLFMESLTNCSNLPQAKGSEIILMEQTVYRLSRCMVSNEKFPSYALSGYHKVRLILTGTIESVIEVLLFIETMV